MMHAFSAIRRKLQPTIQAGRLLVTDIRSARKPPVLVAGLPRAGTTWLGRTLGQAPGLRYFHEPFNVGKVAEARPYLMRYLRADDYEPAFAELCREAFEGRGKHERMRGGHPFQSDLRWPARHLVKDVHVCLALDWISRHIGAQTVIIVRHPCAIASSWARLREHFPDDAHWDVDTHVAPLLSQPALFEDHLAPYRETIAAAETYFEKLGVLWGATYHVILRQWENHPNWIVVRHQDLCIDPQRTFADLARRLDLDWTRAVQDHLRDSTSKAGNQPYELRRIAAEEPKKWMIELGNDAAQEVLAFAQRFPAPMAVMAASEAPSLSRLSTLTA